MLSVGSHRHDPTLIPWSCDMETRDRVPAITPSIAQVRERLKRLKRDFRENRHGEFTERVGAILAKRAAAASAERYASAVMAASTNGTTTALSATVTPTQPNSPEQPMEACYPVVLMKTDMHCHDNLEREGEGRFDLLPSYPWDHSLKCYIGRHNSK